MTGPLYFRDFVVGVTFETPARTITETDLVMYAAISGDNNPLHTDAEFAKQSVYGQRVVHGFLGRIVLSGLICKLGILEGSALANLGLDSWRFTRPIFIGDTVHGVLAVLSSRLASKGTGGIVKFEERLVNQRGETVQEGVQVALVGLSPIQ